MGSQIQNIEMISCSVPVSLVGEIIAVVVVVAAVVVVVNRSTAVEEDVSSTVCTALRVISLIIDLWFGFLIDLV